MGHVVVSATRLNGAGDRINRRAGGALTIRLREKIVGLPT